MFGRKGYRTQNIMAMCSFDMLFIFVCPRWKGIAYDTYIFLETLRTLNKKFSKPSACVYNYFKIFLYSLTQIAKITMTRDLCR